MEKHAENMWKSMQKSMQNWKLKKKAPPLVKISKKLTPSGDFFFSKTCIQVDVDATMAAYNIWFKKFWKFWIFQSNFKNFSHFGRFFSKKSCKFINFWGKFKKKLTPPPPEGKKMDPHLGKSHFFSKKTWVWVDVDATMADYNFWLFSKIWNFWFFFGKFWYKKLTLRWKFRKKCTPRGENLKKLTPRGENFGKNAPPEVKISKNRPPLRWFFVHKLAFGLTLMPRWRTTTFDFSASKFKTNWDSI